MLYFCRHTPAVCNLGDSCGTTRGLSTERRGLGVLSPLQRHPRRGSCTRLAAPQVRAPAGENPVVHRRTRSLLLPLCIYKNLRRKTRGTTAGERRAPRCRGVGRDRAQKSPGSRGTPGWGGRGTVLFAGRRLHGSERAVAVAVYLAGAAGAGAPPAAGPRGPCGPAPWRPWWPGPSPRMPPMRWWSWRVWVSNTFCCSGVRVA